MWQQFLSAFFSVRVGCVAVRRASQRSWLLMVSWITVWEPQGQTIRKQMWREAGDVWGACTNRTRTEPGLCSLSAQVEKAAFISLYYCSGSHSLFSTAYFYDFPALYTPSWVLEVLCNILLNHSCYCRGKQYRDCKPLSSCLRKPAFSIQGIDLLSIRWSAGKGWSSFC